MLRICAPVPGDLLRRHGLSQVEAALARVQSVSYGEPVLLGSVTVTALPAGYGLGSAWSAQRESNN